MAKPPNPSQPGKLPVVNDAAVQRRKIFAKAYFATKFDGTAAAIMAGYSPKSAKFQASELLSEPAVRDLIAEEFKRVEKRHDITIDKVVAELGLLGFSSMANYTRKEGGMLRMDFTETTDIQLSAIQEMTVDETILSGDEGDGESKVISRKTRFKLHSKHGPLQDLLKYLTPNPGQGNEGGVTNNLFLTQVNITQQDAAKEYQTFVRGQ